MAKKWECFILGAAFGITSCAITDQLLGLHVATYKKPQSIDLINKQNLNNNKNDVLKVSISRDSVDFLKSSIQKMPIVE